MARLSCLVLVITLGLGCVHAPTSLTAVSAPVPSRRLAIGLDVDDTDVLCIQSFQTDLPLEPGHDGWKCVSILSIRQFVRHSRLAAVEGRLHVNEPTVHIRLEPLNPIE